MRHRVTLKKRFPVCAVVVSISISRKACGKRRDLKRLVANSGAGASLTDKCLRKEIVNVVEYRRRFIRGVSIGQDRTAGLLRLFSTA